MSDGESTVLLKRISELERALSEANADAKRRRLKGRDSAKELESLRSERDQLLRERDTLKSTPGEWQAKAEALQSQLLTREHRDAWLRVVGESLQDRVPLEEVWGKIEYKVSEQIPSEAEIKSQVKAAREAAPYLFRQDSEPAPAAPRGAQSSNEPREMRSSPSAVPFDGSRGERDTGQPRFVVRSSDYHDPKFMMANSKKIADHSRKGTLQVLPD